MENKKSVWLGLFSLVFLIVQIIIFFHNVPVPDYKILLLSLNPEFAYQQTMEFPVWICSVFSNSTYIEPIIILNIVRSIVLILNLFFVFHLIKNLTKLPWIAFGFVLIIQTVFLINTVSLQFLLWFLFFIPSLHFFISATESTQFNLKAKRHLIISAILFGFTFLIHPVSYLVFVVMFGSLLFTRSTNLKPITYLSFLILFLFLSPKILWEIQNAAKPDCPYFVYSDIDHSKETLSNHMVIDDRFNRWGELYLTRDKSKIYSLLSSFENQHMFQWRYDKHSYEYLTFVFSAPNGIEKQIVKNGYSEIKLSPSVDDQLFFSVNQNKPEFLKPFSFILFWLGQWGIFLVVPILLFFTSSDKSIFYQDMKYYVILVFVAALILTLIKIGVDRPRPLKVYGDLVNVWFTPVRHNSFPSGDAQAVFTMITPLFWLRRKWFYFFLPIAILTAINRVVTGAHFPYDVFVGSLLGLTIAGIMKFWLWDREKT